MEGINNLQSHQPRRAGAGFEPRSFSSSSPLHRKLRQGEHRSVGRLDGQWEEGQGPGSHSSTPIPWLGARETLNKPTSVTGTWGLRKEHWGARVLKPNWHHPLLPPNLSEPTHPHPQGPHTPEQRREDLMGTHTLQGHHCNPALSQSLRGPTGLATSASHDQSNVLLTKSRKEGCPSPRPAGAMCLPSGRCPGSSTSALGPCCSRQQLRPQPSKPFEAS